MEDLESGRRSREVKQGQPLRADSEALGTHEGARGRGGGTLGMKGRRDQNKPFLSVVLSLTNRESGSGQT